MAAKQTNHNQSFTCVARNIIPLVPREKKTSSKASCRSQEFWGKFYIYRQTVSVIAVSERVLYDNLISSTWGDYVTVHRKEIYQLTYRALALRQSKWNDSLRRRVNTWNFSFRNSLRWTIYIINAVDKTKLSWQKEWQTGRRKIERTDRKDWRIHVSQADTGCCVPEFGAKWAL